MRRISLIVTVVVSVLSLSGLCFPFRAAAVPASPVPADDSIVSPSTFSTLMQSDTNTFDARQWGDEWYHGWETADGHSIVLNEATSNWEYAQADLEGWLVPSGIVVGALPVPPPAALGLRLSGNALIAVGNMRATQLLRTLKAVTGTPGTINMPVVLINFSGSATSYVASDLETLLFGAAQKNMHNYYQEVSYGILGLSSGLGAGTSGVVGWFTASQAHGYYGTNSASRPVPDAWPGDLVYEAVDAADTQLAAGFDFSQYDRNGDCYVDAVMIVHQGTGEEIGGIGAAPTAADIWSHKWSLSGAFAAGRINVANAAVNVANIPYVTNDTDASCPGGYLIDDYILVPELLLGPPGPAVLPGLGVFVHEFGHVLGLPDLYDVDSSSEGIGFWGLMGKGSWGFPQGSYPGSSPVHLTAWSKYFLSWVSPRGVGGTKTNEPIDEASLNADVYKLLAGAPLSGEYYLVENRQKSGFDSGLPLWMGEGLLIWHVDGHLISDRIAANAVNTDECNPSLVTCLVDHYGVALVQADDQWQLESGTNYGDTFDPYNLTNNTDFSPTTLPSSDLYDGAVTHARVENVSAAGATMTATLSAPVPPIPFVPPVTKDDCFIATAVYGSKMADEVQVLRNFRDRYLMKNETGRAFVQFYYEVSPRLAAHIAEHDSVRTLVRAALTPLIFGIQYPVIMIVLVLLAAILIIVRKHLFTRRT